MKKTLTAFAFVLLTASMASAGPINFGFESGALAPGWTPTLVGGTATVVTDFTDPDPNGSPQYLPNEGSYFLVLETGSGEVNQFVTQPFVMLSGETIYGAAAFTTTEGPTGLVYNDEASATILNASTNQVVWSANVLGPGVNQTGQYGSLPWSFWSFTNTSALPEIFVLAYTVMNDQDAAFPSYALFDEATAAQVPDGGSALALLGLGMIGLSTLRRKLF